MLGYAGFVNEENPIVGVDTIGTRNTNPIVGVDTLGTRSAAQSSAVMNRLIAQDAQIKALKKAMSGETLSKTDALIVELTLIGRQASQAPSATERSSAKIIELTTAGKAPTAPPAISERSAFKIIDLIIAVMWSSSAVTAVAILR